MPQPSAKNISNISGTEPGYGYVNGILMPNRGYLYVTVYNDSVKVDYVKTYLVSEENASRHNGDIAYSYTIKTSDGSNVINNPELVKIYPNPSKGKITIQFLENITGYHFNICNSSGQVVLQTQQKEINVSHLPNGIYYLNIDTEKYHITKKFFINN